MNVRTQVVKEYLEKFPEAKSLTLAKKILKETGILFDSVEQVRGNIKQQRGQNGDRCRNQLKDRRFIRDDTVRGTDNKYQLPETDALEYPVFKFPKAQNRILVASDGHVPYHCTDAINCMIDWAKEHDINTVLLNGDWMDCHTQSYFLKDPRNKNFREERDVLWEMLDRLQEALPNAVFYYRQANHERRYENFMKTQAPLLFDTPEFQFDILMKFGERGIVYIADKIRVQAGKLMILHGDEYRGGTTSVNPARWLFLRAGASAMCGHFHQVSEHSATNINDDIITCWSVGALCNLHPEWLVLNNWSHGFARVIVNGDDSFKVTNLRIYEGKVL